MRFTISSFCNLGGCVRVGQLPTGNIVVTSTRQPRITLLFTPDEWRDFIAGVKAGEFDYRGEGADE